MATYHGIQNNVIYAQPDFTASQNDKGGWTASRSYILTRATWNLSTYRAKFARGVNITTLDTDIEPYHSFLTINTANPTYIEGDLVMVSVEFSGGSYSQYDIGSGSPASEITYRLEGRLSDRPVSEHPDFLALTEDVRVALGRLINGEAQLVNDPTEGYLIRFGEFGGTYDFPITPQDTVIGADPVAFGFALRINEGRTSYFSPTLTYTETRQGTSPIPSSTLTNLGKIATPNGTPPDPGTGRDWMLTGASQEQNGDLYQTSLEWTASDDDGWDQFFYS
jgi:hypothetical protein